MEPKDCLEYLHALGASAMGNSEVMGSYLLKKAEMAASDLTHRLAAAAAKRIKEQNDRMDHQDKNV